MASRKKQIQISKFFIVFLVAALMAGLAGEIKLVNAQTAPIANDDLFGYVKDGTRNVLAPGVLGNDTYGPGYTLSVTIPPTHGTLSSPLPVDGSFAYTAASGFAGTDSFTYELCQGGVCDTAVVTLINSVSCQIDSDGPNELPEDGQKDMTQFCVDTSSDNPIMMSWNWDEITLTGGGQSADACALFDTNDDQLANYAICNSWNGTQQQVAGYPKLYSCTDTKPLNCSGSVEITPTFGSTCKIFDGQDPFPAGDAYPRDTKSVCSIYLGDVGGANAKLLDVCSIPSGSPSSSASDCVSASFTKGNLEIEKDVVPDDATTQWTMTVTGTTPFTTTVVDDLPGTNRAVLAGAYTITESVGTANLSDYYVTTWKCTNSAPATPVVTTGTGTTISNLSIANGDIFLCTFTNTAKVDLTVTKTDYDYPAYAVRGGTIDYKITVTNKTMSIDSFAATGVVVSDILDVNLTVPDADPLTAGHQVAATVTRDINGTTPWTDPATICTWAAGPSGTGGTITCLLSSAMIVSEVTTIEFTADVGMTTPIGSGIEYGECTQNPNKQGTADVDVCNVVSVAGTNEAFGVRGDNSDSDPKDVGKPNAVTILYFTATGEVNQIRLDWATETETNNAGFNLYRAPSLNGRRTKLNSELIPGNPGGMGAEYSYIDKVKSGKAFYYWLESVDVYGYTELYSEYAYAKALKK